jgi:hypothetical protein
MDTLQPNTNYVVCKKQFSVHSEDRDIKYWPNPSLFEVCSPVDYKNIVALRLTDIEFPNSIYVFSNINQNTKLSFSIKGIMYQITITSGTYTHIQFANELTGAMNAEVSKTINGYTYFKIEYNPITAKLMFLNNQDNFTLHFKTPNAYECEESYFCNYTKWGLGSYLGFNKTDYCSTFTTIPMYWSSITAPISAYYVEPEYPVLIQNDGQIYMELHLFNNIDEIRPYAERSNSTYFAKYGGKHNSSFAKIPISRLYNDPIIYNTFTANPPLERIDKFKFRLRYHDGREVDLNHMNYNFTLEVSILRPDSKPLYKGNLS